MEPHLAPEALNAFLQGTSGPQRAASIEAHIDACEECRVLLSNLVRSRPDAGNLETQQVLGPWLPVAEGETIGGKYRVERVLGSGGMGVVMSAWHLQLNQRVALKFMQPSLAADAQAAMRFQREARAAARLNSTHVGKVLDLDALPNGTPFVVMEFLDGEGLDRRLISARTIAPSVALEWARQALTALAEAHAAGIVHRDVKPANLFLAKRPDGAEVIKVLDFGIAKSADPDIEHGLSSTSSRLMLGSPPYMPPEQFEPGTAISARADVWAMGVVLYQLLSGKLPFDHENLVDVMYAIRHRPHRALKEAAPLLPTKLVAIVETCLKKDPAARYADAAVMLIAVEEALRVAPIALLVPAPGASSRMIPMVAAAAAVLIAGVSLAVWRPWVQTPEPVRPPPPARARPALRPELVEAPLPEPVPVQVRAKTSPPAPLRPTPPPPAAAPLASKTSPAAPAPSPALVTKTAPPEPAPVIVKTSPAPPIAKTPATSPAAGPIAKSSPAPVNKTEPVPPPAAAPMAKISPAPVNKTEPVPPPTIGKTAPAPAIARTTPTPSSAKTAPTSAPPSAAAPAPVAAKTVRPAPIRRPPPVAMKVGPAPAPPAAAPIKKPRPTGSAVTDPEFEERR